MVPAGGGCTLAAGDARVFPSMEKRYYLKMRSRHPGFAHF
jgi:hypothetical protein